MTQTFTYPTVTTIDSFYTNSEGYLITPESLEFGTGYYLVEVAAPFGYVLDSTPVYFDVTEDNSIKDDGLILVEVTKANTAQKGVIKIGKTGEVFSTVTENGGIYQPVYEVKGLPGAVFKITAAEDIYTPDGTLRYSAGQVVDTVTSDKTGNAVSKALYLGKFKIREITAPAGMIASKEVHVVELTYAGQEVEITETAASIYNERQKVAVTLEKAMEQNELFGIGMNGEITAVTFGLYAAEKLTAADGTVIPANGLIEIVYIDENGHGAVGTDLPMGSYYLKERATDSHYVLSDEKYPIVFENASQDTALVEIKANNGSPIDNHLIYGDIHGLKKDDNGNALAGAVIGLFRADATEFTADNALMTATSAEDGSFRFEHIPYGDWLVREIESPTGFILSETSYPVNISKDGAVVEIEVENIRIRGTVQLTKVDKDYPDNKLSGAVFDVYQDSNGNKELDAGDKLMGINSRANSTAFSMDSAYFLLSSLEVLDDERNFVRKADMFTKRTIKQKVVVTSVDTASEALAVSLAERACVDLGYMASLMGGGEKIPQIVEDLKDVIFKDPTSGPFDIDGDAISWYKGWQTADEYLSGNVREKLATAKLAAESDPAFQVNVQALEKVQPVDLTANEISVRLGADWLPTEVIQQFMFELLDTPNYAQWNIKVHHSRHTRAWNIEGKSSDKSNIKASNTYGTNRINAYKIIEETLNQRDVRIFDYVEDENGKRVPVLNKKETAIAQGKQELIKQAFQDWIWKDPHRREQLCQLYNVKFNSTRPREYDGSHLNFVGINPEITLRPHQVNAIAHILYGGNTLLAHVVGAGKTFEMVAAAQESKRLGLCQKSLFVVPNHLTEQWAAEYLQLYPSANILVATKKDFETKNRKDDVVTFL